MIKVAPAIRPELDPEYVPAVLWNREYRKLAAETAGSKRVVFSFKRPNGTVSVFDTVMLPHTAEYREINIKYAERIIKFLLWMKGGYEVVIANAPELAEDIAAIYSPAGERKFDYEIMGETIYGRPFKVTAVALEETPAESEMQVKLGGHLDGCRIGFDLGGSDRKCAAVIDGKVVHTEEVVWDPYFQKDPEYHKAGIRDSLRRAAEKLPRVDAIGGSAAGVYVDNHPRLASLFRGISKEDFAKHIVPIFDEIQKEYNVPFVVANDGEVTALAGAMSMESNGVLGLSMGTSQAIGYVNVNGNITDWLNELAFAPVDYRDDAPADEWSGDIGCGAQYFSQQAVARLAPAAGLEYPSDMPFPKRLEAVQALMAEGDERAAKIYRTIGVCFGYAIAHYADFYEIKNLLILGRVSSGKGGEIIIEEAKKVLEKEFPELASGITFRIPDEKFKRHGQAVIAASLPTIG
ncbi:MAG: ROK family protein [Lentisphaeria bacterium]|nr:ROK family protein [Lentisphaeria bacterium]MBO5764752.1 ROK family protein [Lentisphaeria bacterium]MBO5990649.1 ROK family protein [Lentisphaeria bacterium]MBO7152513.1 ROK family protein [Lentisphaeria bacterium]